MGGFSQTYPCVNRGILVRLRQAARKGSHSSSLGTCLVKKAGTKILTCLESCGPDVSNPCPEVPDFWSHVPGVSLRPVLPGLAVEDELLRQHLALSPPNQVLTREKCIRVSQAGGKYSLIVLSDWGSPFPCWPALWAEGMGRMGARGAGTRRRNGNKISLGRR